MEKAHFVLYSKPGCPQCRALTFYFKAKHFNFQDHYYNNEEETNCVDINSENERKRKWSEKKRQKFIDEGFKSFPVVRVYNDEKNELVETFTGNNRGEVDRLLKQFDFSA